MRPTRKDGHTTVGAIKDKGRQLHQIERVPYEDAFLISDLLTTRITVLSGEPKAGKTLLSAGMGIALVNREPTFLGQPVLGKLDHIVFGLTDDGAPEELKERLHGAVPDDAVTIFPVEDRGEPDYWTGICQDLVNMKPGLFVLDNIIGALAPGEDISSPVTAQRIMRSLKPISEAGIPTLLVTHTPKGSADGMSVASSPIGGRAIAAGARAVIALRNSGKHGRRIHTAINRATEDLNLKVTVRRANESSEVPVCPLCQPWVRRSASAGEGALAGGREEGIYVLLVDRVLRLVELALDGAEASSLPILCDQVDARIPLVVLRPRPVGPHPNAGELLGPLRVSAQVLDHELLEAGSPVSVHGGAVTDRLENVVHRRRGLSQRASHPIAVGGARAHTPENLH